MSTFWTVDHRSAKPCRCSKIHAFARHDRVHAIPRLGRIPLSRLRWEAIDAALAAKGATLSPRTIHHLRAVIRSVLQSALKERLVRVNEATLVDPQYVPKRPVRATEPKEAFAILEAVKGDRLEALVTVALWSRCRQGELLALAWRHVDLDAGRFVIRRTLGLGRDAKGEPKFDLGAKTEKSVRTVRIRPSTVAVLREHRKRQLAERLAVASRWHDHDLVFASTIGTPLDPGDLETLGRRSRPSMSRTIDRSAVSLIVECPRSVRCP